MKENAKENELVKKLTNKHYTITTAESCTGGLLSATIINVSGASDVINCAYVTYANEAKENLVSVSHETLETKGAVSKETADTEAQDQPESSEDPAEGRRQTQGQSKSFSDE